MSLPAAPPSSQQSDLPRRDRRRTVLVVAGAVVAGLAALYLVAVALSSSGVPRGTSVLGVDIGGQSREQAIATLTSTVGATAARPITVDAADTSLDLSPGDAGLTFDAAATVDASADSRWNPWSLARHLLGTVSVDPVVVTDDAALRTQIDQVADGVDVKPVEPTLAVTGATPKLTKGKPGRALDRDAAAAAVRRAFLASRSGPVRLPVTDLAPAVSATAAQQVVEQVARPALAAPVTVRADTATATLSPAQLAAALSFVVRDGALVPELDGSALHAAIAGDLAGVETGGNEATFTIVKGKPQVVPSKVGKGVADADLAAAVLTVLPQPAPRTATVAVTTREPALSTEVAKTLGVKEKLSSFTQNFPYAAYRVKNIGQAAQYMDGTLVMPGAVYSMNDTIKERTVANGYTEGFVIGEGGIFREDLGGGVSTATTANWTAAFYAGMERVNVQAHSIWISRYRPGLEATVAWGSFDMQWRNNSPTAVFIQASITNTSVTVTLWGTKSYDRIEAVSGPRTSVVPFKKVYSQAPDCMAQGGVEGFTIVVDRVFVRGGAVVQREPITTKYAPSPTVICGEKPDKNAPPDPTASPSPGATGVTPVPAPSPSA
ncbi:MAG: vanomycin resistance protein VanB [Actinomycetota bacterium]|nr:MAG: vanomycin resistance protein VanB [Actinomycetota bacterium]